MILPKMSTNDLIRDYYIERCEELKKSLFIFGIGYVAIIAFTIWQASETNEQRQIIKDLEKSYMEENRCLN